MLLDNNDTCVKIRLNLKPLNDVDTNLTNERFTSVVIVSNQSPASLTHFCKCGKISEV